ncbi:hypothetical protein DLREEDagr8_52440 [Dongia sp. agr-C8]
MRPTGRLPYHSAKPAQAAAIATRRAAVVPGIFNAAGGWFPATPASDTVRFQGAKLPPNP